MESQAMNMIGRACQVLTRNTFWLNYHQKCDRLCIQSRLNVLLKYGKDLSQYTQILPTGPQKDISLNFGSRQTTG